MFNHKVEQKDVTRDNLGGLETGYLKSLTFDNCHASTDKEGKNEQMI